MCRRNGIEKLESSIRIRKFENNLFVLEILFIEINN